MVIPKICYFYWENSKMSFLRYMSIRSFKYHNPDFKVILITKKQKTKKQEQQFEEQQDINYYNGPCYWEECLKLDIKIEYLEEHYKDLNIFNFKTQYNSDILTWFILGYKGGFIADTDIIFTKSLDYDRYKNVDLSMFSYDNNFAIGFLFGKPNRICRELYELGINSDKNNYQTVGGLLFRDYILKYGNIFPEMNICLISNDLVYPYVNKMNWKQSLEFPWIYKSSALPSSTCGIHWYGGAEISKKFNIKLTKDNYFKYNNTICYYIHEVLKNDR